MLAIMKKSSVFLIAAAIVMPVAARAATAAGQPKPLGVFKSWTAATYGSGKAKVCYAFATAKQAKDAKGAPAMLTVAERAKFRDEISLSQGITYAKGETVTMKVGSQGLKFFTKDNMAYALKGGDTVKAFLHGASAVASAKGKDGKTVSDTFSLQGFAAAYKAIEKACPPPGAGGTSGKAGKGKS